MKVIPIIIGCLKESIRQIFEYDRTRVDFSRNGKDCTMGKRIPDKKSLIWTVDMKCFNLTNKFWSLKSPLIPFFSKFEFNQY